MDYSVTVLGSHKDVSNDLPGRASAVLDLQQSMTKTFDDPGRNNPYGSTPGVWLGALYPLNGPVCGQANNGDPGEVDVTAGVAPGKYCFWQYHPEQSQSMESISNIPEGDEPGVEQEFAHPSAYAVVSVTQSPNGNSACPLRMAGSSTGSGPSYIVASSVSGLTCSPPAQQ